MCIQIILSVIAFVKNVKFALYVFYITTNILSHLRKYVILIFCNYEIRIVF